MNDRPELTVLANGTTAEDTRFCTGAGLVTVYDLDDPAAELQLTVATSQGTLLLRDASVTLVSGNGTAVVVYRGTQAELQTAFGTMCLDPPLNYVGPAYVSLNVTDLSPVSEKWDAGMVVVSVTAVNDAPVLTVLRNASAVEDTAMLLGVGLFGLSDVDVGAGNLALRLTSAARLFVLWRTAVEVCSGI